MAAVDIGKQYLDSLKEISNEWRRSWVGISVTIPIEQKDVGYCVCVYIYIMLLSRPLIKKRGSSNKIENLFLVSDRIL